MTKTLEQTLQEGKRASTVSLVNPPFDDLYKISELCPNIKELKINWVDPLGELSFLKNLNKLKRLSILNSTPLPEFYSNLETSSIKELSIRGSQLTHIPSWIYRLTNLTKLDLWDNNISSIDVDISNLLKITTLKLGNNNISQIPENLLNLHKLKYLDIRGNRLDFKELDGIKRVSKFEIIS